ncbi:MAG: hypothetical protein JWN21_222 [Sphingomonas bacterium]|uniref:DUF6311 domain-containing protein n=1 Tax=Sphingomonas bacterium TaxID=1895847 RepID=UPI00262666E1|nr:DUF6311 domain-containing protein [Sphingomonas bacterium]MDB5694679.1 hypothetical protein [Sphingomonas bacterium]
MRRSVFPSAVVVLAILVFVAWMHPAVLWPTNVGWLVSGEDRGQSALGLAAYLRSGGWGLHQPLLSAPEGLPLLFTDSIPLLGVLLRPFASLLPPDAQFVGIWYLLCVLLQATFAALLIRPRVADPLAAWLGVALLTAMPVLFNRYGHPSLCAQWLILASLWLFLEPRRAERAIGWAVLLAVAALVHSYLLLMVAAFWGSALVAQLARDKRNFRTAGQALLTLLPTVGLLALNGVFDGPYRSTHSYGQFPAALDAWWNPGNPGYTALPISSPAMPEGRGFEGFNYLGAGLIALVLFAAARFVSGQADDSQRVLLRRMAWLLPAFGVLLLLAIGPAPMWRGLPLFALNLPSMLVDALDPIRASGRLVWPLTYTLAFVAIIGSATLARASLVLAGALALQVIDVAPMLSAVRATSARATEPRAFMRTADPRWQALIARAADVQFEPAEPFRDLQLLQEVSWRAIVHCRPVRYTYSSRVSRATQARLDADAAAFRAGRLEPTRLYVLLSDGPVPAAVAARVQTIDGIRLIAPSRPAPLTCP